MKFITRKLMNFVIAILSSRTWLSLLAVLDTSIIMMGVYEDSTIMVAAGGVALVAVLVLSVLGDAT